MLAQLWAAVGLALCAWACSGNVFPADTPPALGPSATVIAIGDSITKGTVATSSGYCDTVDLDAIAAGFTSLNWIGQQFRSGATYVPTQHHEGISGDTAELKNATFSTLYGPGKLDHGFDVAIVFLGTNDLHSKWLQYLNFMLNLHSAEPQARFVVIAPDSGTVGAPDYPANAADLTASGGFWDRMVAAHMWVYRGTNTLVHPGDYQGDTIHPTEGGGMVKLGHAISAPFIAALQGLPPGTYPDLQPGNDNATDFSWAQVWVLPTREERKRRARRGGRMPLKRAA